MNQPPSSKTRTPPHPDLCRTRQRFLLAREQVAAQGSAERYFAVRAMREWAPRSRRTR
jgi:hypothetical protein